MKDWAGSAIEQALVRTENVHVLYCGDDTSPRLPSTVRVHRLDAIELTHTDRVRSVEEQAPVDRSDRVRIALQSHFRQYRFDEIHFGIRRGLGFRCLQAKRAGLRFESIALVAHLDTCSQRLREQSQMWPADVDDLLLDFMEKYCFENADRRETHPTEAEEFIRQLQWKLTSIVEMPTAETPLVTIGIAHFNLGEFLPAALASLAAQTYSTLEVIVIDDGSTHPLSIATLVDMEKRYPQFRFLHQENAGIGATRNRCLAEARGEFFIPMDADNIARPDMVERFVAAMLRNPSYSALTCYFLAFSECQSTEPSRFLYAGRPTGGPHSLSCIRNVYGDANGIFRTMEFREIGGYETDRGTSCEDWEAYVKLVHAGKQIGVIPDYLFYYRHRDAGFSRSTNWFLNHQRVLRQFTSPAQMPPGEAAALWTALLGFQQQALHLAERLKCRRYRIADAIHKLLTALSPRRWFAKLRLTRRS